MSRGEVINNPSNLSVESDHRNLRRTLCVRSPHILEPGYGLDGASGISPLRKLKRLNVGSGPPNDQLRLEWSRTRFSVLRISQTLGSRRSRSDNNFGPFPTETLLNAPVRGSEFMKWVAQLMCRSRNRPPIPTTGLVGFERPGGDCFPSYPCITEVLQLTGNLVYARCTYGVDSGILLSRVDPLSPHDRYARLPLPLAWPESAKPTWPECDSRRAGGGMEKLIRVPPSRAARGNHRIRRCR